MQRAIALDYTALAVTDECSFAGVVRAHDACVDFSFKLKLIIGSEFRFTGDEADGETSESPLPRSRIVLLAKSRTGYEAISQLITRARRQADKGSYLFHRADLHDELHDCLCLYVPDLPVRALQDAAGEAARVAALAADALRIARHFPGRAWIAAELHAGPNDRANRAALDALGQATGLPVVAAGDVHMHERARKMLCDVVTAIRLNIPVADCGHALFPNGDRHLRSRLSLARAYKGRYAWLEESARIAGICDFSLEELRYEYPDEVVPAGQTASSHLRALTLAGLNERFPAGASAEVIRQMESELRLIAELRYESYFLTVHDIVQFARGQGILCQGRGSAANSVVCYCLHITEVDPSRHQLMFARFLSRERNEPPDIDVDFEHERREEVIQYLYAKYGRHRTALAAAVAQYRPRGALRDIGKALGLSPDQLDAVAKNLAWWDGGSVLAERLAECGLDPEAPVIQQLMKLAGQLVGMPRHLSQHSGGFVIARENLSKLVPVENAAMPERTVIQWDKNDLESLGLMKVDVLGLGMLTMIRRALHMMGERRGRPFAMSQIPKEDPWVYRMLCAGESTGVFQVESRAQMSMLPRLRPVRFYDLVIEVAIVRPGPIQGGMVHPYLRRRQGLEKVSYPRPEIRDVLKRTLGVSIFQEQVIQLAVKAANFQPGEADDLRRAMAAWKRKGGLQPLKDRLFDGMRKNGYTDDYIEQIYQQMQGFGEYGFPESHASSFALLVYVSSWLKRHEPAIFLYALLNSQPLGFYAPAQLIQDARRNRVQVLPVDVNASDWEATLEEPAAQTRAWCEVLEQRLAKGDYTPPPEDKDSDAPPPPPPPPTEPYLPAPQAAVRLGLKMVKNLSAQGAERLVAARQARPYTDVHDLTHRARLDRGDLEALAAADALAAISGHRRRAVWDVIGVEAPLPLTPESATPESAAALAPPSEGEDLMQDYATLSLTLRRHPLALLRPLLAKRRLLTSAQLRDFPHGRLARACGLVTGRQRPGTAKGTIFVTLEDETGYINVICWPSLIDQFRREILSSKLMTVYGVWETEGHVAHLIAKRIVDDTALLGRLQPPRSRDFH